ncbi:ABC transporter permease [Candidatus Saccharibacteria bacterium]|nr:ABC transporter permease [Candidatus Saccharibacteria bacterium]
MSGSPFKRKIINTKRVFVIGAHSFIRNTWLSVAATVVMSITLACILLTMFASYTLNNTVQSFTDKIDVSIFFKPDATKEQIEDLSSSLRNNSDLEVKEITYISKEEARAIYEESVKDSIAELQALAQSNADTLPASIRIKTYDTAKLQSVVEVTRSKKYSKIVDQDSYKDDAKRVAVDRLGNIAKFLRNAGLVASVLFGSISILVILNTIRMAIFNRKDEIEIMQLIGASKWYIRGPFLVEASIYGAIAGIFASLFFYLVVLGQAPKLGSYVEEIRPTVERFQNLVWLFVPATIAIGVIIGSFSAYLAIRKHLRLNTTK